MKLKILFYGLNFAPEEIGIGKYSGEMVTFLAEQGHSVTVVTAPPYYPQWRVGAGFKSWCYSRDAVSTSRRTQRANSPTPATSGDAEHVFSEGRVDVVRCPLWVPKKVNGLKRIIHLASFGLSSLPVVLWKSLRLRPDVVIVIEPTAFCLPTAWLASRLAGCKTWLHIQDFEVDAAFELGILRHPILMRTVQWCEAFWMRRFDRVSSISPKMVARLRHKKVLAEQTRLFPNWVDCDLMRPLCYPPDETQDSPLSSDGRETSARLPVMNNIHRSDLPPVSVGERLPVPPPHLRKQFDIPANKCVALYAGNIGWKQGLEIVIQAAQLAEARPDIHFVICGQGAAYPSLLELSRGKTNIQLLPVQPLERFNELMNAADIHLLPQKGDAADLVMPSKLTGMLATGRPVVASANDNTQIAQTLAGRGSVVRPGDSQAFFDAIVALADNPMRRTELGIASRQYAVEHLSQKAILCAFLQELAELCASKRNRRTPVNYTRMTTTVCPLPIKSIGQSPYRDSSDLP